MPAEGTGRFKAHKKLPESATILRASTCWTQPRMRDEPHAFKVKGVAILIFNCGGNKIEEGEGGVANYFSYQGR